MNKREFIRHCADETQLSQKQVSDVLDYIVSYIKDKLFTNKTVSCFGLGKLCIVKRRSRRHYNIQTGGYYEPHDYQTVTFKPSSELQHLLGK